MDPCRAGRGVFIGGRNRRGSQDCWTGRTAPAHTARQVTGKIRGGSGVVAGHTLVEILRQCATDELGLTEPGFSGRLGELFAQAGGEP